MFNNRRIWLDDDVDDNFFVNLYYVQLHKNSKGVVSASYNLWQEFYYLINVI